MCFSNIRVDFNGKITKTSADTSCILVYKGLWFLVGILSAVISVQLEKNAKCERLLAVWRTLFFCNEISSKCVWSQSYETAIFDPRPSTNRFPWAWTIRATSRINETKNENSIVQFRRYFYFCRVCSARVLEPITINWNHSTQIIYAARS